MSIPADQLAESALSLPETARADLALRLLQSLHPSGEEISHQTLGEELIGRIEQYQAGEISSVSLEEVRASVEQALDKRSGS